MGTETKKQPTIGQDYESETFRRITVATRLSRKMAVLAHCKRDLYEINSSFELTVPESRKIESALQLVTDMLDLHLKL